MKVIKKINNNVAVCEDNHHHEVIAFGKGIGFPSMPYELQDLSMITRTYYGVESQYLGLLNEIPEAIFEISAKVVDLARNKIDCELNANILFTLADHINFAVERFRKGILVKNPLYYDIEHLYTTEVEIGNYALKLIQAEEKVHLPSNEAFSIALHFINAQEQFKSTSCDYNVENLIEGITLIVENYAKMKVNRKSFNYSRYFSHIQYLLKRRENNAGISSENQAMFDSMIEQFPKAHGCALEISEYLKKEIDWKSSDEELLYLMLHINRLCVREDCNQ